MGDVETAEILNLFQYDRECRDYKNKFGTKGSPE